MTLHHALIVIALALVIAAVPTHPRQLNLLAAGLACALATLLF